MKFSKKNSVFALLDQDPDTDPPTWMIPDLIRIRITGRMHQYSLVTYLIFFQKAGCRRTLARRRRQRQPGTSIHFLPKVLRVLWIVFFCKFVSMLRIHIDLSGTESTLSGESRSRSWFYFDDQYFINLQWEFYQNFMKHLNTFLLRPLWRTSVASWEASIAPPRKHTILENIKFTFLSWNLESNPQSQLILVPSVSDLDPHGSALILVSWIRIRIQEGKKYPQIVRVETSSSSLDVLYRGLGICKLLNFQLSIFLFWVPG